MSGFSPSLYLGEKGCVRYYNLVRTLPSPCTAFSQSLSVNSFSVTYPRRTGGKRLDKNRMHMRALLFEIQR